MNDEKKNMTFHTHFVHRTLTKIKKLHAQDIVELTSGYSFILYCILAILLFVLLLSMCFCPALVFGLMKCIINNILQFVTWIASLTYEGLQFIFSAAVIAYRARRQNQNSDILDNQAIRPIQSEQPTIQNEVQFCDPSIPNDCPTTPVASVVASVSRPILKSLK